MQKETKGKQDMKTSSPIKDIRKAEYKINRIFTDRWSPRAMSGEDISDEELMQLFEAAKWAPSSYNNQHWRFIYAKRNTKYWDTFLSLLVEFNQSWAKNAAVLVIVASKNTFDHNGTPAITHSFDTGAAWENLALQGSMNNLAVHGMQGFDYDKAREAINLPKDYSVEMMCAIGRHGTKEDLAEELQKRELPSDRKQLSQLVYEGVFNG